MAPPLTETASGTRAGSGTDRFSFGFALHGAGRLAEAERIYRQCLADDPDHARACHHLGLVLLQQGQAAAALSWLERALVLKDDQPDWFNRAGAALTALERPTEAEAMYRRALALDGGHVPSLSNLALLAGARGDGGQAESLWRRVLAAHPDNRDAHANLAEILRDRGQAAEAVPHYQAALAATPDSPDLLNNLGACYRALGETARAIAQFSELVSRYPDHVIGHVNLANALRANGDPAGARRHFGIALALEPNNVQGHVDCGRMLLEAGDLDQAVIHFRHVLSGDPNHRAALNGLGMVQRKRGKPAKAEATFAKALACNPDSIETLTNLGNCLLENDKVEAAEVHFRRAVALDPARPELHSNLGTALRLLGRIDEAVAALREAVRLRPDYAEGYNNLGNALGLAGAFDEAESAYREALAHDPSSAGASQNLGMALLSRGAFAAGFDAYERRWDDPSVWRRDFPQPMWQGEPLKGRRLLVWGEQGVGDQIMLASVLPGIIAESDRLVVECEPRLRPLFARSFATIDVVAATRPPAPVIGQCDVQAPLGSLCRWRRRAAADFRDPEAYLRADPGRLAACRRRYRDRFGDRLKVGIAWRSKTPRWGLVKTAPLAAWDPILATAGVGFVNLQYGDVAQDIGSVQARLGVEIFQDPAIDQMQSLDDFAAQIAALDLVISISNTTVHVAGALGQPVWTILSYTPDWRWQRAGATSLWYPAMRLYRQPRLNAWSEAFAQVHDDLIRLLERRA